MTRNEVIKEIGEDIKNGKIGVIPTDTIYGIVCSAMEKKSVEKIYKIRKRNSKKPMIILISSVKDLDLFNVKIDKKITKKYWPGKVSIIVPIKKFEYLHRGKNSLAFRLPDNKELIKLLKISGPIVAPSANTEGNEPAQTIDEAKEYFKDKVDFYVDCGKLKSKPSKIISLLNNNIEIIRK
ncbi:MAG TPA: L-threonylcarbamoyladenylate synthase [Candidatus Pacearchaeota archaeon]|nr:L-threonylcarbamoyladenylate synthase [Candidatus Pacearchaeota archaeon]HPR80074.1 L-threonylcarbamoyladenylate synthase [Candidatus Pacearchaeota archaeon]